MDNSGTQPLKVPGIHLPLDYELDASQEQFMHDIGGWQQEPAITARELAMLAIMDRLSDQANWYNDIFDENIVASWKQDAFANEALISEEAWAWCVSELRDKARMYDELGYVRVLDTGSCVCKSDTLVSTTVAESLRELVVPLLPPCLGVGPVGSDIVDPSMYPLVYTRNSVLTEQGAEVPSQPVECRDNSRRFSCQ